MTDQEERTEEDTPERAASRLSSWIITAWYEHFFDHESWRFGSAGKFRLATEEEYRSLGEDADADDAPLILARESDGVFFEIDLDATVWQTTAEERQQKRDLYARMAARSKQQQEAGASA